MTIFLKNEKVSSIKVEKDHALLTCCGAGHFVKSDPVASWLTGLFPFCRNIRILFHKH